MGLGIGVGVVCPPLDELSPLVAPELWLEFPAVAPGNWLEFEQAVNRTKSENKLVANMFFLTS